MRSFGFGSLGTVVRLPALALAAGALMLGGGVLAGGCGSSPELTTESSFCQALAQADCSPAAVQACFSPSAATANADTQTCVAIRSGPEVCNPQNLRVYNPDFAQPCVDAHAAYYGSAQLDPNLLQAMNTACAAALNNGGRTSQACESDLDCDVGSGLSCVTHAGGGGSCQTPLQITPGEACGSPAAECVDESGNLGSFYCENTGHCVNDPGNGMACGAGIPCSQSFRCIAGQNGSGGSCAPKLGDQQPCKADGDCTGGFCIATANGALCAGAPPALAFGGASCSSFVPK